MRIPIKSERDAFYFVFGGVVVIALAILLGVAAGPLAGVALVVGVAFGGLLWELATRDPARDHPIRAAAEAGRSAEPDGRRRVLVIANQTVAGRELREELMKRTAQNPVLRVVCPILPSRAHLVTSDIDRELAEARERLDRTLAWASEHGLKITGHVSQETPLGAIEDELREFPADELIVSTHPKARSKWLETGLIERLTEELDIPVRHVVVDLEREHAIQRQ